MSTSSATSNISSRRDKNNRMGSASGRLADSTTLTHNIPDIILENILLFVPAKHLVMKCSLVCKTWHTCINSRSFWKRKCELELPSTMIPREKDSGVMLDYRNICICRPFGRNLVKNWNAKGTKEALTLAEIEHNIFITSVPVRQG